MLYPLMTGIWYLVQTDDEAAAIYAEDDREGLENEWFDNDEGEWNDQVIAIYKLAAGQLYAQDLDDWAREINAETIANDNHNRSMRGPQ